MSLELGQRYERDQSDRTWPETLLRKERRIRVGRVALILEMRGGGEINGDLDQVVDGVVGLDDGTMARSEDVEAFTLLDPDSRLDRSDESRGT